MSGKVPNPQELEKKIERAPIGAEPTQCDHPLEAIQFSEDAPPVCTMPKCGMELTGPEIEERSRQVSQRLREIDSEIAARKTEKAELLRKQDLIFGRGICKTCDSPILYESSTVPLGPGRPREICDDCRRKDQRERTARWYADHPKSRRKRHKNKSPKRPTLGTIPPNLKLGPDGMPIFHGS